MALAPRRPITNPRCESEALREDQGEEAGSGGTDS